MGQINRAFKDASSLIGADRQREVAELCLKVFDQEPVRLSFPGGKSRAAFFAEMGPEQGNATYVLAKRGNNNDAKLEAKILQMLGRRGLVPRLKALSGEWVVQEFLKGERLPVLLDSMATMKLRKQIVSTALERLLRIHEVAQSLGLDKQVPVIGRDETWFWNRSGAAKRMSKDIDIGEPAIDRRFIVKTLLGRRDEFIKFDARPGNAIIHEKQAFWIDWEDCGCGNAIEDLAFVLFDEWSLLDEKTEAEMVQEFLPLFNHTLSGEQAFEHLSVYGVMHTVIRLRMALKLYLRDGRWWNRSYCLSGDKVGVTKTESARLIDRGKRWADQIPKLRPLVAWLDEIKAFFDIPDHVETLPGLRAA